MVASAQPLVAFRGIAFVFSSALVLFRLTLPAPVRSRRQAGRNAPRILVLFFGAGVVDRARRDGLLSVAARKMRLMRVW
jgi:hypothetical protein